MLISVIVPVYNVGALLQQCVESILKNDCTDCEVILVDDGSTDGISGRLCDEYAARYPDLIVAVHTENGGHGAARNTGIQYARGQYLLFVDSDDYIKDGYLDMVRKTAVQYDCDVIQLGFQNEINGQTGEKLIEKLPAYTKFTLSDLPEMITMTPSVCTRVWKRSLFIDADIQFPGRAWYEDIRASLKLLALAKGIVAIPEAYYVYVHRDGSIMNNSKTEQNRQILSAFDDLISWYKEKGLWEQYYDVFLQAAAYHIMILASVRVAKIDPGHPLLPAFQTYMNEMFPDYKRNKAFRRYMKNLPGYYKVMLFLTENRLYGIIFWLYRIKEKRTDRT